MNTREGKEMKIPAKISPEKLKRKRKDDDDNDDAVESHEPKRLDNSKKVKLQNRKTSLIHGAKRIGLRWRPGLIR